MRSAVTAPVAQPLSVFALVSEINVGTIHQSLVTTTADDVLAIAAILYSLC